MPVPTNATPLPRTAAGLSAALREFLADEEQYRAAVQHLRDLVDWLSRRTRPDRAATAYFSRYLAVAEHLGELVAALADALVQRDVQAAPLYWVELAEGTYWHPNVGPELIGADPNAVVVDIETGQMVSAVDDYWSFRPAAVPWWPTVPPSLAAQGFTVLTCPSDELEIGDVASSGSRRGQPHPYGGYSGVWTAPPIDYAQTMALLSGHAAAYTDLSKSLNRLQTPEATRARMAIHKSAAQFRAYYEAFAPIADRMAAELAQFLDEADAALVTLANLPTIPGDTPMPQLSTATPASVSTLAGQIRDQITSGHGGRLAVSSDAEVAFSWSPGVASTLLRYLALGTAAGRRTTVVIAANSATPIASVAELGTKPSVVNFTSSEVNLLKFAGVAEMSVESSMFVANVEVAIANIMTSGILRAIEAHTVQAILADAGVAIAGAVDMTSGVLEAVATIRSNGGTPTVVGLAAADWISIMTATGGSGFVNFSSPEAGPGTWLGLTPCVVPTMVEGTAVVLDGSAVTVLETAGGPLCVTDMWTKLSTNEVRIAVETWATSVVNAPGGVATVGVTPAGGAARSAAKK